MGEKKLIGKTANGVDVYVIVDNEHMQAHSDVREAMIAEAIKKMTYENTTFKMETFDMGRIIGNNSCVKTGPEDKVVEVARPGRTNKSKIVCYREPEPTSLFTVGVCTDDDKLVTVFTSFPGPLAPKEMTDPRLTDAERADAIAFWSTHALCSTAVFGQPVPPGVELDKNQAQDNQKENILE